MLHRRVPRVNSLLKEVISEVLRKDLHHLTGLRGLLTVMSVEIAADLSVAKVFISVIGDQKAKQATIDALNNAAGKIAHVAMKKVVLRTFPKLHFYIDEGLEKQMRICEILEKVARKHTEEESSSLLRAFCLSDKPSGRTSFSVVACVRKKTMQATVGHAGTLDPFATGLLVILLGRAWTRQAATFLHHDKEYEATFCLGQERDSYDRDGNVVATSDYIPTLEEIQRCLLHFQGEYIQTPPMFSAKKIGGKRLYELARKGIAVERQTSVVKVATTLLSYSYPEVKVYIYCSKGTYVRAIAQDFGKRLGCLAYVEQLCRTACGHFRLSQALSFPTVETLTPESTHPFLVRSLYSVSYELIPKLPRILSQIA